MPDTDGSDNPGHDVKESGPPPVRAIWGIGYIKRKLHERRTKYKEETPADKASRRTANATWAIAILTVVLAGVGVITLVEVIEGGNDTHELAVQAKKQAEKTGTLVTETHTLADNAGKQATNAADEVRKLEDLVTATNDQAAAMVTSANAAKSSASTASDSIRKGNRPWVGTDGPMVMDSPIQIFFGIPKPGGIAPSNVKVSGEVNFTLKNFGRDPAFHVGFDIGIVNNQNAGENVAAFLNDLNDSVQANCVISDQGIKPIIKGEEGSGATLFPGNTIQVRHYSVNVTSPSQETGYGLFIGGCIVYMDQFKAIHHTRFCFTSNGFAPESNVHQGDELRQCKTTGDAT